MNILLLVTGSISAYKAVDIANSLRHRGHSVKIVLSAAAMKFIPVLTFTGQRYDCYTDADEWNGPHPGVLHIDLAKWADTVLLAPATINTIAKFVNGITDNLVLSIMRAFKGTIYIAPAMNTQMYLNSAPFLYKLRTFNTVIINPQVKLLACGDTGIGGLADKKDIIDILLAPLFPVKLNYVGESSDSNSYLKIHVGVDVELPLEVHVGGYGFVRTRHVHEGVDLYTFAGEKIYACESGTLLSKGHFTGTHVDTPWWNDTQFIAVEHQGAGCRTGYANMYGELMFDPEIENAPIGTSIKKGQCIGYVKPVLLKDKGRPMSMLHFEQHSNPKEIEWDATYINGPLYTMNPTEYLKNSTKTVSGFFITT